MHRVDRTLTNRLHQSMQHVEVIEALEVLCLRKNIDHLLEVFLAGTSDQPRDSVGQTKK